MPWNLSNLENTFGYRASRGFTGDQLFPLIWKAKQILEAGGFVGRFVENFGES